MREELAARDIEALKAAIISLSDHPNTAQSQLDLEFIKKVVDTIHLLSQTRCLDPVEPAAERANQWHFAYEESKVAVKELRKTINECLGILASAQ